MIPKTSMVKLHDAVKSVTGDRTRNLIVLRPTDSSPASCLAQTGSESTYLSMKIN